jgi:hypothetical protein
MKKRVRELSLKIRKPRSDKPERNSEVIPPDETKNPGTTSIGFDEELWHRDMATLRRAAEEIASRRPIPHPTERRINPDSFHRLAASLGDSNEADKAPVIRKLYKMDPERAATFLNNNLQECTPEERQQIGAALEASGLVDEAIRNLTGNSHTRSYRAFSLLFLVAKAGAVRPLLRIIEGHPNTELRLALIRLLGSSQAPDLVFQFQRLLANNSLPPELSNATREVIANTKKPSLSAIGKGAL